MEKFQKWFSSLSKVSQALVIVAIIFITGISSIFHVYFPEKIEDAKSLEETSKEIEYFTIEFNIRGSGEESPALAGVSIEVETSIGTPKRTITDSGGFGDVIIPAQEQVTINLTKCGYTSQRLTTDLEYTERQKLEYFLRKSSENSNCDASELGS